MILRLIPSLLAGIAMVLATLASVRVPAHSMPWMIPAFLLAQGFSDLLNVVNLHRAQNHQPEYTLCFTVTSVAAMGLGIAVAWKAIYSAFPSAWPGLVLVTAVYSLAWGLLVLRRSRFEDWAFSTIGYSTLLLCCGTLCAWASLADLKPALKIAAIVLGVKWNLQGAFGLAYSVGVTKNYWAWFKANHCVTQFVAILCALWLCVWYSHLQSESAKPLWAETVRLEARP